MPPKPASQSRARGRGGACPVGGRRSRRDAPTPKRHRGASSASDDYDSASKVGPAVVADSLLACLSKDDDLVLSFIDKLFKMPSLQDKIVAQVLKVLNSTPNENVVKDTASAVSHDLTNTIENCQIMLKNSRRPNKIQKPMRRTGAVFAQKHHYFWNYGKRYNTS